MYLLSEKAARIKAARDEAQAEINKFRQAMEQEFQTAQFGVSTSYYEKISYLMMYYMCMYLRARVRVCMSIQALSGGDKSIRLASETEAQLNEIKQRAAANRFPLYFLAKSRDFHDVCCPLTPHRGLQSAGASTDFVLDRDCGCYSAKEGRQRLMHSLR